MKIENELYAGHFEYHLRQLIDRLRAIPADRWDWTPNQAAPTARITATHAWQWLVCDRQHIVEPNAMKHSRVPDPPEAPEALCQLLEVEADWWIPMIQACPPERFNETRPQFGMGDVLTIRCYIGHMLQNIIYKNGQLSMLYFALGLDGTEPYDAPFPNPEYERAWAGLPFEA